MTAKTKPKAQSLPVWDLSDIVPAPAPAHIRKKLAALGRSAQAFRTRHAGRLDRLPPAVFGRAIAEYEKISSGLARLYIYTDLDLQTKQGDAKAGQLYQTVMERVNDVTADMLFFELEINKIPAARLKAKLKDRTVLRYRPWLDSVRAFMPHQLADDVEKALFERSVTGHPAWIRLYDETSARLRFRVESSDVTLDEALHGMLHRSAKKRKASALALEKGLAENIGTFSLALNTIAMEQAVDSRQRGFKTPSAFRNRENEVEDEVVDALTRAVRGEYKNLSHRYYKLKAKWMGVKQLNHWDRNAPLPFSAEVKIPWPKAREDVLAAYGAFHPEMKRIAALFFENNWIDARPRPGKYSGGFSASVAGVHPYILLNHRNGVDDVMTLAHELGHGIHQTLSAEQGYLMADTSLPLAETASVFGEMLVFRSFLAREKNPRTRKAVIAAKVEDMLNTVTRQTAYHMFETTVHSERKVGELTPERLSEIWMDNMRDSLGPAFRFTSGYAHFWACIPHFFHSPFYVYAYAFGDCLVNALYAVYHESGKEFADKYLDLLKAGGTKKHHALLAPFGLDARDPRFWKKGLSVIEGLIDELHEYGP